jgi:sugar phosphate isomerase/epimerase
MNTSSLFGKWAFSTLGCPGASLEDVIAIAQRHNCGAIELRVAPSEFLFVGATDEEVAAVRGDLDRANIMVLALMSYVRLCDSEIEEGDPQLDQLRDHLDIAQRIGAPGVRVFLGDEAATPGPVSDRIDLSAGERRAISRLDAVAEQCSASGVDVFIETHDSHSTGVEVAAFLSALEADGPRSHVRLIWDSVHSWSHGEPPATTFDLLGERIAYIQVRDIRSAADPVPVLPGTGGYPMNDLHAALESAHWRGSVSFEWERAWHPELPPLDVALDEAERWAPDVIAPRREVGEDHPRS